MDFIRHLRIGARLALAFGLLVSLLGVVTLVAITRLSGVSGALVLISADRVPKVVQISEVVDQVNLIARELRNTLIWDEPGKVSGALETVRKAREKIDGHMQKLAPTITSDEGRKRLALVKEREAQYLPVQQTFVEMITAGRRSEAETLLSDAMRPAQLAYIQALDELKDLQLTLIHKAAEDGRSSYQQAKLLLAVLLLGAVAVGVALGWLITRSITQPLHTAVTATERVASGDLGFALTISGRDETARLLTALSAMQQRLAQTVGGIRHTSAAIASAGTQIASGNTHLSQRLEEQASSLQQTAASMEQLGSTVRQNADNAEQANRLAVGASEVAVRGGDVVGEVVETMKGIQDSSRRIADIIGVIDGIAFQTNILALNAAVEAARAGEQGRGFAVVAAEVRNLAQRTSEAAKEIKRLIVDSVDRVEQGTSLVDRAGSTMQQVVESIQRVTHIMNEISHASREQSTGVSQVGEAVGQMDQMTQQNAAFVEQAAAAADGLKAQADALVQAVSVFNTDARPAPAAA